jgi:acetoin utilization protein AcuB
MNVIDIMTGDPVTIRHKGTLQHAIKLMEQKECRHLPVLSDDLHLIGILSDRDCRLAMNSPHILPEAWQEKAINRIPVTAVMSPAPIIIEPHVPVHEAARLMLKHHISALPVMRGETLVGIITTSDLLVALMTLDQRGIIDPSRLTQDDHCR